MPTCTSDRTNSVPSLSATILLGIAPSCDAKNVERVTAAPPLITTTTGTEAFTAAGTGVAAGPEYGGPGLQVAESKLESGWQKWLKPRSMALKPSTLPHVSSRTKPTFASFCRPESVALRPRSCVVAQSWRDPLDPLQHHLNLSQPLPH